METKFTPLITCEPKCKLYGYALAHFAKHSAWLGLGSTGDQYSWLPIAPKRLPASGPNASRTAIRFPSDTKSIKSPVWMR